MIEATGTAMVVGWLMLVGLSGLLPGVVDRLIAFRWGRRGPSPIQSLRDMAKQLIKERQSADGTFVVGTAAISAFTIAAAAMVPAGPVPAMLNFSGDVFFSMGLLAGARFAWVWSAVASGDPTLAWTARRAASATVDSLGLLLLAAIAALRAGESGLETVFSWTDIQSRLSVSTGKTASPAHWAGLLTAGFAIWVDRPARAAGADGRKWLGSAGTIVDRSLHRQLGGFDLACLRFSESLRRLTFVAMAFALISPFNFTYWNPTAALLATLGIVVAASVAFDVAERLTPPPDAAMRRILALLAAGMIAAAHGFSV